MSDEELKAMAEKAVTKMVIIQQRILDETTKGMSEEENAKFSFYYLASLGAAKSLVNDDEIDFHTLLDGVDSAYEMVYENDQKPDWDA